MVISYIINNNDSLLTGQTIFGDLNITGGTLSISNLGGGTSVSNLGIDANGVVVTGTGGTNTFTTGVTLNGTVLEFDRTDLTNAYNVELSGLTSSNFANTDLILTENRAHELNGNNLQIGEGASIFSLSGSNFSAITGGFLIINTQASGLLHTANRYIEVNNADISFYNENNVTDITSNAVTFNKNGGDVDFVIEGDIDNNLFFTDASTDRIGIGTSTPSEKLEVSGNTKINGTLVVESITTDFLTANTINVSQILSFEPGYLGFDPTEAIDGDMWYRSDLNQIRVKLNNTILILSTTAPI